MIEIAGSAGAIVIVSERVPELAPFCALTVNVDVPAVVGVPEIAPVEELRESPEGRVPELTDQVTSETPAVSVAV